MLDADHTAEGIADILLARRILKATKDYTPYIHILYISLLGCVGFTGIKTLFTHAVCLTEVLIWQLGKSLNYFYGFLPYCVFCFKLKCFNVEIVGHIFY